jgi:mannosidase alpha-like ER degradation enhancer 1
MNFPKKMRLPEEGFVVLLDRGECTFLEKLVHAAKVGASGAIVAGLPPSSSSSDEMDTDGLLRPSAEGEATALLKEVEDVGLVYVDWRTGDVLREKTRLKTGEITMVEVLPMDGQVAPGRLQNEEGYSSPTGRGRQAREGRVGIGEWPIWNLRIVEVL